jgi:hypothetical protein
MNAMTNRNGVVGIACLDKYVIETCRNCGAKGLEDNSLIFILPSPDNKWKRCDPGLRPSMIAAHPDEIEALWADVIAGEPGD